jgi:hypothetical protein
MNNNISFETKKLKMMKNQEKLKMSEENKIDNQA